MKRLLSLVPIFLILMGAHGCAALRPDFEPPRITLVSLQPDSATLFEQKYLIQLRIQNPNDWALSVRGLHYDLELNGQPFLSGLSSESVVIPPFSEAVVGSEGVSTLFSFLRQIEELNRGARQALEYRLSGRVSVDNLPGGVRFDYAGELFSYRADEAPATPRTPRTHSTPSLPPGESVRM